MDLFKLAGTIAINNTEANKALDETSEKGNQSQSKLSGTFSKIGKSAAVVAKAVGAGMVAAGVAVSGLVTKSVQSYAEYEQLVGGIDTLFKGSSQKVQDYAKNAYMTAGMSANEYMETVTGFSASLLQSLGNDTDAAATKANMALTDMSDNANKMGTDMESIKNAYSGFAKQNYTMLDNLKLGYGGTKTEMQRLLTDAQKFSGIEYDISSYADVVDAIHVVQTEMDITGTTAKEASTTISGSVNSMKGSWQNLLTAFISSDLSLEDSINNFVNSVSTVVGNVLPAVQSALGGVVQLIDQLAPMLISKLPSILSSLLPSIISCATNLINSVVTILPSLINMLVTSVLPALITGFTQVINALITALPTLISSVMAALPTLIPLLVNALVSIIVTLCTMLPQIIQPIIDNLPMIIISLVDALMTNLPQLIQGLVTLVVGIVAALPQIIQALISALPTVMQSILDGLIGAFPALIQGLWSIIKSAFTYIVSMVKVYWNLVKAIFTTVLNVIKTVVSTVWNGIKTVISTVLNAIKTVVTNVWNGIKNTISTVFNGIKTVVTTVWNGIKKTISTVLNGIKTVVSNIWNGIKNTISNVVTGIKSKVSSVFNSIKTAISTPLNAVKSTVTNIFNNVKTAMTKPIETAKATIKSGIDKIKGFFSGLKLKFPNIKLPHFKVSGKLSLSPPSVPKLSIDWYAKAMNDPMVLNDPTIFGYNPSTGSFLGGGEAGSEVVAGTGSLLNMIQSAVASENNAIAYYLQKVITLLGDFFPQVIATAGHDIVTNDGVIVAKYAPLFDTELGKLSNRKDRGR